VIAIIIVKEKPNVKIIWAVEEKIYGNNPRTFNDAMKRNKEKIKGKNL